MSKSEHVVATEDLWIGSVRAHYKGERVLRRDAEANGWTDVANPGTKAARDAQEPPADESDA